ncbi:MAG: cytochrome c oxidase subunit [Solirubrobacterales bacterium]|jgi:cytochrome c oxidase subunit 2|nr:cytochrome c oxidase subunit [Solirubrobacterales bacterium]
MDNQTVFFVLGPCLVAVALIVSFVGLRYDKFPGTRGLLVGATIAIAALVVATMTFAWRNAEDEQSKRDAELASSVAQDEQAGNTTAADETAGSQAPAEAAAGGDTAPAQTTAAVDGAEVFATAGCTGCHTLADAGSTATTGPDLDAALKGKDTTFIHDSIVDPNKFVEKGYPPNIMPQTYADQLSLEELDAVVSYLADVTNGKG